MKNLFVAVLILVALSLFFLTGFADAHGRHGYYGGGWRNGGHGGWVGRGWYPGVYGGVGFGSGLYPGYLMAPRFYAAPPYTYNQTFPRNWERRWDPHRQRYMNVYVPPARVSYR